jgi:hypothetical protein
MATSDSLHFSLGSVDLTFSLLPVPLIYLATFRYDFDKKRTRPGSGGEKWLTIKVPRKGQLDRQKT